MTPLERRAGRAVHEVVGGRRGAHALDGEGSVGMMDCVQAAARVVALLLPSTVGDGEPRDTDAEVVAVAAHDAALAAGRGRLEAMEAGVRAAAEAAAARRAPSR